LFAFYSVELSAKIKCLPFPPYTDHLQPGESPFQNAPQVLEQRPLALKQIPSPVHALLSLIDVIGLDELDSAGRKVIDEYYGEQITSDWDMPISQFGGLPLPNQGHQNNVCPNQRCPANKLEHPYGELMEQYLMKELALITGTEEPILDEHCFQILYSICAVCYSLQAEYRCS
jgi:hypothetical protein